ncbi:MAG: hypothetical protein QNJ55_29895 [Xenococcus sp. MO_188.B8]|nr:hypothetical protein [Xenococcus sp. MO_188.B8]
MNSNDKNNWKCLTKTYNPFYWLGFTREKATVREFVFLLVLGLVFYGVLHRKFPPSPPLSLKAKLARTEVLREITEQQKEIQNKLNLASEISSPEEAPIETKTPEAPSSFKQTQNTIKQWRTELVPFFSDRPETEFPIKDILTEIEAILTKLEKVNFAELKIDDVREIQQLLTNLQNLLQVDELFWTDNKKWLEIIFWSLFGTLCYLIKQTSDYYLREKYHRHIPGDQAKNYLIRYKPKYYFFLFRSPFYTLIILFILSEANLEIIGISLSLSTLGIPVLVALAFILGFANRVTTEQLDMIIAAIFKDAYQRTLRKIDIYPSTQVIKYGESFDFQVVPNVKVKWSIWSKPSVGTIDAATGMYIAPPKKGYVYDELGNLKKPDQDEIFKAQEVPIYQQVIIRAEREYESSVSSLALVILINDETKLMVSPEESNINYPLEDSKNETQQTRFCIELKNPSISGKNFPVEWTISPAGIGKFDYDKGEYTPPKKFPDDSQKTIKLTVRAAMHNYPSIFDEAKVILQPPPTDATSDTTGVSETNASIKTLENKALMKSDEPPSNREDSE